MFNTNLNVSEVYISASDSLRYRKLISVGVDAIISISQAFLSHASVSLSAVKETQNAMWPFYFAPFIPSTKNWCESVKPVVSTPNAVAVGLAEGQRGRIGRREFIWRLLDDVFEAEGAVAGQPLALAPAAQVLPVGPLWVNMALRFCTGTSGFVAPLERQRHLVDATATRLHTHLRTYVTCDVLHAVRVKVFLAFPTELLEVNLEETSV